MEEKKVEKLGFGLIRLPPYYLVHDMAGERRETAEKIRVFEFLAEKKAAEMINKSGTNKP